MKNKIIISLMMSVSLLGGCAARSEYVSSGNDHQTNYDKRHFEEDEEEYQQEKERDNLRDAEINIVLDMMESNFNGTAEVWFDYERNVFMVYPLGETFGAEMYLAISGDERYIDDWLSLSDSQAEFSSKIKDLIGEGYGLALLNPANEKNTILLCMDGVILYDGVAGGSDVR